MGPFRLTGAAAGAAAVVIMLNAISPLRRTVPDILDDSEMVIKRLI